MVEQLVSRLQDSWLEEMARILCSLSAMEGLVRKLALVIQRSYICFMFLNVETDLIDR